MCAAQPVARGDARRVGARGARQRPLTPLARQARASSISAISPVSRASSSAVCRAARAPRRARAAPPRAAPPARPPAGAARPSPDGGPRSRGSRDRGLLELAMRGRVGEALGLGRGCLRAQRDDLLLEDDRALRAALLLDREPALALGREGGSALRILEPALRLLELARRAVPLGLEAALVLLRRCKGLEGALARRARLLEQAPARQPARPRGRCRAPPLDGAVARDDLARLRHVVASGMAPGEIERRAKISDEDRAREPAGEQVGDPVRRRDPLGEPPQEARLGRERSEGRLVVRRGRGRLLGREDGAPRLGAVQVADEGQRAVTGGDGRPPRGTGPGIPSTALSDSGRTSRKSATTPAHRCARPAPCRSGASGRRADAGEAVLDVLERAHALVEPRQLLAAAPRRSRPSRADESAISRASRRRRSAPSSAPLAGLRRRAAVRAGLVGARRQIELLATRLVRLGREPLGARLEPLELPAQNARACSPSPPAAPRRRPARRDAPRASRSARGRALADRGLLGPERRERAPPAARAPRRSFPGPPRARRAPPPPPRAALRRPRLRLEPRRLAARLLRAAASSRIADSSRSISRASRCISSRAAAIAASSSRRVSREASSSAS
jgi:hypothetical protein